MAEFLQWLKTPGLNHFLILSALLFSLGVYAILSRRNAIMVLMGIELILNAANINFIAFSRVHTLNPETGQVFVIFIITLAATAATVGLAIVLALYRVRRTIYTDEVNLLKW